MNVVFCIIYTDENKNLPRFYRYREDCYHIRQKQFFLHILTLGANNGMKVENFTTQY